MFYVCYKLFNVSWSSFIAPSVNFGALNVNLASAITLGQCETVMLGSNVFAEDQTVECFHCKCWVCLNVIYIYIF